MKHLKTFNQINEGTGSPAVINRVKDEFGIKDWNSEEGKEQRQKVAKDLASTYEKIMVALRSTVSDDKKAEVIKKIITGSMYAAIIFGLWNVVHPDWSYLIDREIFGHDLSILKIKPDWGDAFRWGGIAVFLFMLRFVHSVLVTGRAVKENIKKMLNSIFGGIFKKKDESFELDENLLNEQYETLKNI